MRDRDSAAERRVAHDQVEESVLVKTALSNKRDPFAPRVVLKQEVSVDQVVMARQVAPSLLDAVQSLSIELMIELDSPDILVQDRIQIPVSQT